MNAPHEPTAEPSDTSARDGSGEARLRELGYEQSLERRLTLRGSIALTLSDITPAGSLLVVGIAVVSVSGSGSVLAYIAGCALAVFVALCMAELGSVFPLAGGVYSIVVRVLGRPPAFLTLLSYIVQAIFLPASIALGIGTYLNALHPAIPVNLSAAVAMAVVTMLALLRIQVNAVMTGIFLVLEMVVIVVVAIAGFTNVSQPVSAFLNPVGVVDGALTSFGAGAVIAGVAIAMQSVNGYDAAIAFAEETRGSARTVGKAVLLSCALGIVLELAAFLGAAFGAPDMEGFLGSTTPLTWVVEQHWGRGAVTVVIIGAVIAFFNACLAITLQFARVVWTSGRDSVWPRVVSDALRKVHPATQVPWVATIVIGVPAIVLCWLSSLVAVVTFVSVLTITLYVFVAVAAIVHRVRDRDVQRPFRMPLWPLPPVVAIVGAGVALSQQAVHDLLIVAILFLLGLAYYLFYLRPRGRGVAELGSAGPAETSTQD